MPKNHLQNITKITEDYGHRHLKAVGISNNNQFAIFDSTQSDRVEIWSLKRCSLLRTTRFNRKYSNWYLLDDCDLVELETNTKDQQNPIKHLPNISNRANDHKFHDYGRIALMDFDYQKDHGIFFGELYLYDEGWGNRRGSVRAMLIKMHNIETIKPTRAPLSRRVTAQKVIFIRKPF